MCELVLVFSCNTGQRGQDVGAVCVCVSGYT